MTDCPTQYQERLTRYTTAMRNEQPDRVPLRPFVAEFVGVHAGCSCQELVFDLERVFEATRRCAVDFQWDAVNSNMVAVWAGLCEAIGLEYYAWPGVHLAPDVTFQYREPREEEAYMKPEEYDHLIDDPTGFIYEVFLPRATRSMRQSGEPVTLEHNLSLVRGGMAMMEYFAAHQRQADRLRRECGVVPALAGCLKAPMDLLADRLRGYLGLVSDLYERPQKVLAACEAMMPHVVRFALAGADPDKNVPLGFWMHRGCVPFISFKHFNDIYWPTVKPVIQELWAHGHQTLFYAEGNWDHHLDAFAQLPERSIVYHVDQGDLFKAQKAFGDKFCLSGGVSNVLLGHRPAAEVRSRCKEILTTVARNGGYIMDASAIMQNDTKPENLRAMTEATLEYGVYSRGHNAPAPVSGGPRPRPEDARPGAFVSMESGRRPAGTTLPWSERRRELPDRMTNEELCRTTWEKVDAFAHTFAWMVLEG